MGKQYLVFAGGSQEPYGISACSGTAPLSQAPNEVELLREQRSGRLKSRLFGTVFGTIPARPSQTSLDLRHVGIPNVVITASGNRGHLWTTTTDKEGRFVFVGLPPGVYTVRAQGPPSDARLRTERVTLDNCGAGALFFGFNLPPALTRPIRLGRNLSAAR
jgi:hypothetical protein